MSDVMEETTTVEKAAKAVVNRHREMNKAGDKFSTKATHEGYKLYAVKPEVRKEGKEGYEGMQAIVASQGISFEDWAALGHGMNHLNWDLNRGAVAAVPAGEDFDLEAAKLKVAKKPKVTKAETAESADPEDDDQDDGEGSDDEGDDSDE